MQRLMLSPPDPHPHLQARKAIPAAHPLLVDRPSLAAQEHPDPQIAKPGPGVGQLRDP